MSVILGSLRWRGGTLVRSMALAPAVFGLVSTSFLFGYASSALKPMPERSSYASSLQASRADADDSGSGDIPEGEVRLHSGQQPIENYRATLSLLKKNYYGAPIDAKRTRSLTYEAIRGMLGSLRDQFTSFLDPDDWSQMRATTEGDFEGIGALLEQDGAHVRILKPIETSPAAVAGVRANDIVVAIDGVSVTGMGVNDVVRRIKGREGSPVRLGILRGKTRYEFTLKRALIEPPVVQHWMEDEDGKVGRILLTEFNERSVAQLHRAYDDLKRNGVRALILDLRDNPGGLLETAEDVASLFIAREDDNDLKNIIVYIREGAGHEKGDRLRTPEFQVQRMPMAVLVNGNSASASEIVAGALKDYGVVTLIGERTYGKGRVQTLYPLDDGSALRLTTALYFTPRHYDINFERDQNGRKVDGTGGILPDIDVKPPARRRFEDFKDRAGDTQLHVAVDFLRARLSGKSVLEAQEMVSTGH